MTQLKFWVVYLAYRLLSASWRIRFYESEGLKRWLQSGHGVVFAHWHGQDFTLLHMIRRYPIATMASTHRDGAMVDFAVRRLGGSTARGSSTRHGANALRGLVRQVRGGHIAGVAVDGPRGPLHVPKPGVFELSRLCRVPIVPVGVAARPAKVFEGAWNKMMVPWPFATVVIAFGEPLPMLEDTADPRAPAHGEALRTAIYAETAWARERLERGR